MTDAARPLALAAALALSACGVKAPPRPPERAASRPPPAAPAPAAPTPPPASSPTP